MMSEAKKDCTDGLVNNMRTKFEIKQKLDFVRTIRLPQYREKIVRDYFERQGFKVIRTGANGAKHYSIGDWNKFIEKRKPLQKIPLLGIPDFFVSKPDEEFWVEVKSVEAPDLNENQLNWIKLHGDVNYNIIIAVVMTNIMKKDIVVLANYSLLSDESRNKIIYYR